MTDDLRRADWSDKVLVSKLAASYHRRYGETFWKLFEELVGRARRGRVIEFGCGPGLFLVDCVRRLGTTVAYGIDASEEMIGRAREFLKSLSSSVAFELISIDLNEAQPDIPSGNTDLVFMGFLLHELDNPQQILALAFNSLRANGVCVVFDYVSGNRDAFVKGMIASGMSETDAQRRYAHMCRYSIDDIIRMLKDTGIEHIRHKRPDAFRVLMSSVKR
ncbi:MAG: class I SAM-dependent methyltransferase [Candidatus Thorarchaeota archaeon]